MGDGWVPDVGVLVVREHNFGNYTDTELCFRDDKTSLNHYNVLARIQYGKAGAYYASFVESLEGEEEKFRDMTIRRYIASPKTLEQFRDLWQEPQYLESWLRHVQDEETLLESQKEMLKSVFRRS